MNTDLPLEQHKKVLEEQSYLLDVFWKVILLDFDAFNDNIKGLFKVDGYSDWNDARKKHALMFRIKAIMESFYNTFKVLYDSFDVALENLRKAKRYHHKFDDASSRRGLEAATMHPVEITETANKCLSQFVVLCDNLKEIGKYMSDTNNFYKDNLRLVMELYSNTKDGLRQWGEVFKNMYKR
jgi:hypothetical protein